MDKAHTVLRVIGVGAGQSLPQEPSPIPPHRPHARLAGGAVAALGTGCQGKQVSWEGAQAQGSEQPGEEGGQWSAEHSGTGVWLWGTEVAGVAGAKPGKAFGGQAQGLDRDLEVSGEHGRSRQSCPLWPRREDCGGEIRAGRRLTGPSTWMLSGVPELDWHLPLVPLPPQPQDRHADAQSRGLFAAFPLPVPTSWHLCGTQCFPSTVLRCCSLSPR